MLLKYHGHIYREAGVREARTVHDITPEYLQRLKKDDWVRVYHGTSLDFGAKDMVFGIDALEKAACSISLNTITYQGHTYRKASVLSWSDLWQEITESKAFETELDNEVDRRLDDNPDAFVDSIEQAVEEELEEEYYDYYEEILSKLNHVDGDHCWRAITITEGIDPTEVNPVGIYWAMSKTEAVPHWSYLEDDPKDWVCVFRGKINSNIIDVGNTIRANTMPSTREGGSELRFEEGKNIWIYDVEMHYAPSMDEKLNIYRSPPDHVLEINDWRKT